MLVTRHIEGIQNASREFKQAGKTIALVPTLGALHEGHRKQIEVARENADVVMVSVFVDPEEFGNNEDFHQYPRVPDLDQEFCEQAGVEALFFPQVEDMYPKNEHSTYVEEYQVSSGLCGISRSHHFRGVATTFLKLYHLANPDVVVITQHQVQRMGVIQRVVRDFFIPAKVVGSPVVRESDGLAADARNAYLTDYQRSEAKEIYQALLAGKKILDSGNSNVDRITAEVINHLRAHRRLHVLYVNIVDPVNLSKIREITPGTSLLCVGILVEQIRLVDHIRL